VLAVFTAGIVLVATGLPTAAQPRESKLEGTIYSAEGEPVPGCRVVTRFVDGTEVFISPPSDESGRYAIEIPSFQDYVLVALVAPTGGRVDLPGSEPFSATPGTVERDITIPMPSAPRPRRGLKGLVGADRLFLSFVEDPATVAGPYGEFQLDAQFSDQVDSTAGVLIGAFSFDSLPRVEIGLRVGYAEVDPKGYSSQSGATDLELWGKLHMYRSAGNRWDLALGALMTFPTGDQDAGLSPDALQSKIFFAGSYAFRTTALVFNVGARATEDAWWVAPDGVKYAVDGRISGSAGIGVIVPLSRSTSLVYEIAYDGEQFEDAGSDTRALAGLNWRTHPHGLLRVGVAAGVESNVPPDAELIVGYALTY